jgi:hypothetical protein
MRLLMPRPVALAALKRLVSLVLVALPLSGCVAAHIKAQERANLQDPHFISAWNNCVRETAAFGLIPDYGITWEQRFYKCMAQANWVQTPRWNPRSVGHYHRVGEEPFNEASPTDQTYRSKGACQSGQYWNSARGRCERIGS